MEGLKMVCDECKGSCWVKDNRCTKCINGYTDTPQEILDAIECDRIERKLLESCVEVECRIFDNDTKIILWLRDDVDFEFCGKTKLEALKSAYDWLKIQNKR